MIMSEKSKILVSINIDTEGKTHMKKRVSFFI